MHTHDDDDDCHKPIMERRVCGCTTVKEVVDEAIAHVKDTFSSERCAIHATVYAMLVTQITANFNHVSSSIEDGDGGVVGAEMLNQSVAMMVRMIMEDDDPYLMDQIKKALAESIDIKQAHKLAVGANLN